MSARGLKLVVYDATDTGPIALPRIERGSDGTAHGTGGLTRWWRLGTVLHRALRADDAVGASSWGEALRWAADVATARGAPIVELQAWGHGGWGYMGLGGERLDTNAIDGSISAEIDGLREALAPGALVWLRCCSAFGTSAGKALATTLAARLRARVAGHTFIIGGWQSGTHSVAPGALPDWDDGEGMEQTAGVMCARVSTMRATRTLSCLRMGLPGGW